MRRAVLFTALLVGCSPAAQRDAQTIVDAVKRVTRTVPPALEHAYAAALVLCDGDVTCTEQVKTTWAPIWDGLAILDAACDAAPGLCDEPGDVP